MRGRVLASVLIAAALLAGCSSGDDDQQTASRRRAGRTTTTDASTTTTTAPSTTTTVAPAASPAPPGPPVAGAPPTAGCPPVPTRVAPAADRPRYQLDVDVRLDENAVVGDLKVHFTPDLATDRLVFRLWPDGPREAKAGAHIDTGPVTVDGRAAQVTRPDATTLVVRTGGTLPAGKAVDASMNWRLTLPGAVNDRISRSGDSVRLGSFFPILAWEPGTGWATEPPTSGFAEASTAPVADFSVAVKVPPGLTPLTSGVAGPDGRFVATAVRDFALSVGRFTVAGGVAHAPGPVQVTIGVAAGIGESPQSYLGQEISSLEDFGQRFGPYPWPSLTLAVTPQLSGGIEYPAHIMQGPGTTNRTLPHEVGHQWFYGLVGNDQGRDPWLDEGLASYAEARHLGNLASFRSRSIPAGARGHAGEPMTYWEPRQSIYYRGVYVQGAQAVAANGDPALVDCALRHYVAANAFRIARPSDLLDAFERVFPRARPVMAPFGIRG